MKLSPENIAAIEALLTDIEDGSGNRALIIKYDLRDLEAVSGWKSVMRSIGVRMAHGNHGSRTKIPKQELADFQRWLLQREVDRAAERQRL